MRNKSYTSSKQEIKYSALVPRRYQNQCISIIKIIVQLWTTCKITVTSVYKDITSSTGARDFHLQRGSYTIHVNILSIPYHSLINSLSNLSFKAQCWTRNNFNLVFHLRYYAKNTLSNTYFMELEIVFFQFSYRIQTFSSTAYKITVFANFLLPL